MSEGSYTYERFAFALFAEDYSTVYQCEEGVVFTHTYILTRIVNRTSLANDDVAGFGELTAEKFYTESFAFGLATVLGTTYSFFVCHISPFFNYATISSTKICVRY